MFDSRAVPQIEAGSVSGSEAVRITVFVVCPVWVVQPSAPRSLHSRNAGWDGRNRASKIIPK